MFSQVIYVPLIYIFHQLHVVICLIFLTFCQCHFSYLHLPLSLDGHPHQHGCQTGPHSVQKQTVFSKGSVYSGQNCIACTHVNDAPPKAFVAGAG